jgi:hypothetical protein
MERVLLDDLVIAQLVKKFQSFVELDGLLRCSQGPTTLHYPEQDESGPQLPNQFL